MVLLVLLFGIISYGYALSFKQGLTQAAAEGARAAAVASTGQAATAAAGAVAPRPRGLQQVLHQRRDDLHLQHAGGRHRLRLPAPYLHPGPGLLRLQELPAHAPSSPASASCCPTR